MLKIKKNDMVEVISGKDKGKNAKVLRVYPKITKVLVEGVNIVKKHTRATRANQQGGIIKVERPIAISNIMLLCKNCNRPVRVGFSVAPDKTKTRICKRCKVTI